MLTFNNSKLEQSLVSTLLALQILPGYNHPIICYIKGSSEQFCIISWNYRELSFNYFSFVCFRNALFNKPVSCITIIAFIDVDPSLSQYAGQFISLFTPTSTPIPAKYKVPVSTYH